MSPKPSRLACALVALALLLGGAPRSADAHGGQFRGPPSPMPSRLTGEGRDPLPPRGPPPPPPSGGEVKAPPKTDAPKRPAMRTPSYVWQSWVYWYAEHRARFEDRKRCVWEPYRGNYIGLAPGPEVTWQTQARSILADLPQRKVLPAIDAVARDAMAHQDLRASAVLALAKLSHDPKHITLLCDLAVGRVKSQGVVRESAACALGLLRRQASAHRLSPKALDGVREELMRIVADGKAPRRTRGMAALALGLLGDQPSADAPAWTARLFERLADASADREVHIGVLVAIGMQAHGTVTDAQRVKLRRAVMLGRWGERDLDRLARAHAIEAVGHVGTDSDLLPLQRMVRSRRTGRGVLARAGVAAIGRLGSRSKSPEARVAVASFLAGLPAWQKHDGLPQWAFMALADLVEADIRDDRTDVLSKTKAGDVLLEVAAKGRYLQRPHAILALARIGRAIGDTTTKAVEGELRQQILDLLRALLFSKKLSARDRGAVAVGLGLLQDMRSAKLLVTLVARRDGFPELRAYAAHALGLIGMATKPVLSVLRDALATGATPHVRREAATSLGLLRDYDGVLGIERQLVSVDGVEARADLIWSMGEVGMENAVAPLLRIMNDPKRPALERAVACAALGELCDLERFGSLTLLRTARNPFDLVDLLWEVRSYI